MYELSLFAGAGLGVFGTHNYLNWRTVGYVEISEYNQKVLKARIIGTQIPSAPVFGDVREFNEHYSRAYQGMVDVVTAGWPCPPVSIAGRREGAGDERWLWGQVVETLRVVRPPWFLGENVKGLLSVNSGSEFGQVLADLAELGYDARWGVLSAAEAGAPQRRERVWIVAFSESNGMERMRAAGEQKSEAPTGEELP